MGCANGAHIGGTLIFEGVFRRDEVVVLSVEGAISGLIHIFHLLHSLFFGLCCPSILFPSLRYNHPTSSDLAASRLVNLSAKRTPLTAFLATNLMGISWTPPRRAAC